MEIEVSKQNSSEIKNYKAEDAEIKRASQENNYIYCLLKKAEGGNCNAIKKLLGYSMINFNPDVEFAANLMNEAREMLDEAYDIYTNGCGKLSDRSINAAKGAVVENNVNNPISKDKEEKEINATLSDLEGSIIQHPQSCQ